MKKYVVFNQRVCGWLMMHGFVLKVIEKSNKDNSNRNVFIFNDTEDLRNCISKYDNFMKEHKAEFINK